MNISPAHFNMSRLTLRRDMATGYARSLLRESGPICRRLAGTSESSTLQLQGRRYGQPSRDSRVTSPRSPRLHFVTPGRPRPLKVKAPLRSPVIARRRAGLSVVGHQGATLGVRVISQYPGRRPHARRRRSERCRFVRDTRRRTESGAVVRAGYFRDRENRYREWRSCSAEGDRPCASAGAFRYPD